MRTDKKSASQVKYNDSTEYKILILTSSFKFHLLLVNIYLCLDFKQIQIIPNLELVFVSFLCPIFGVDSVDGINNNERMWGVISNNTWFGKYFCKEIKRLLYLAQGTVGETTISTFFIVLWYWKLQMNIDYLCHQSFCKVGLPDFFGNRGFGPKRGTSKLLVSLLGRFLRTVDSTVRTASFEKNKAIVLRRFRLFSSVE